MLQLNEQNPKFGAAPKVFLCSSLIFTYLSHLKRGSGSSVGIATDYWLGGPGSNPGGDEIFRPSRPALGPPSLVVQGEPGLSQE